MKRVLAEKPARKMLVDEALAILWKLHTDATTLYRAGNLVSAAALLEIADAAEREWHRHEIISDLEHSFRARRNP